MGYFRAVKLMPYHNPEDVAILRSIGCEYFLVRLPDSVAPDGRWKGMVEWANECEDVIAKFSRVGVKRYQLDNEPNVVWPVASAATWRWLTNGVLERLRRSPRVPSDTLLGLAPLSWNPATWRSVEDVWIPEQRKLLDAHQFVCVHSYWQAAKHYNDPSFGGNVTHWHDALLPSNKPYVITEWASSVHETGLPPEQVEALRVQQYPQWLEWVGTKPYVEAAFLFILGGSNDWQGYWPTRGVLHAMSCKS
jgi:hypothetical protein